MTGDKFEKGYRLLEENNWEGALLFFSAVTDMYLLDAIDEEIYFKLSKYIAGIDYNSKDTEANQWLKIILLDIRYGGLLLKPEDIIMNLKDLLNTFPEIEEDYVIEAFIEGRISKLKYADGRFYYIDKQGELSQNFLVMRVNGESKPIDFDVEDFTVNRVEKRIEYSYIRGTKGRFAIEYDGNNKIQIR